MPAENVDAKMATAVAAAFQTSTEEPPGATPTVTLSSADTPIPPMPSILSADLAAPMIVRLTPQSPTRMLIRWGTTAKGANGIQIIRDGSVVAALDAGVGSYEDINLRSNTRYAYKIVVNRHDGPDAIAEASAATLAHQPQGAGARNIDWNRLQFYIVDERNPEYTEYRVELHHSDGTDVAMSDWSDSTCRILDALRPRARYGFSVTARNLDGVMTAPVDRRAGEGVPHPESLQMRAYEKNDDPWVAARVDDLAEIYGLTESASEWLLDGVRIEWQRGLPGWAGYSDGGYVSIGHSELGTLMHESMHGFWPTWQGWREECDRMNFYTFKRDQAQFMLDFREYDRTGRPNPWEAWRPYYNYLVGILEGHAEKVDIWEIFENRDFSRVGGFYHQQETIFPQHAARKLSLVPPPLQKYFQGFLKQGESRTWAEEVDWYSRLEAADHHLWNLAFATRDILHHSPEMGAPPSAARTRIPEPLRSTLRTADRQRLVDFVNTLEDVEHRDDSDPDSEFWRWYVKRHLFITQFYLPELDPLDRDRIGTRKPGFHPELAGVFGNRPLLRNTNSSRGTRDYFKGCWHLRSPTYSSPENGGCP